MQLKRVKQQHCIICQQYSFNGWTHNQCLTPTAPARLISAFDYHDPLIAKLIIWGKYKFIPEVYTVLGQLLANYLVDNGHSLQNSVVCPIPLAKSRVRWRGFNQSELLSDVLSQTFNCQKENILQRVKATKTQKDLNKQQRIRNLTNSFSLSPTSAAERIILVDDVITTGTTLLEACKTIKQNLENEVWCLTLARD
jgi:competence protein ComFC